MTKEDETNKILEEFLDFMQPNRFGSGWTLVNSTNDFLLFEKTKTKTKFSVKVQSDGSLYPTGDPEGLDKFRQFLSKTNQKGHALMKDGPSGFRRFLGTKLGKWSLVSGIIFIFAIIGSLSNSGTNTNTSSTSVPSAANTNTAQTAADKAADKAAAQKELDDLVDLSKKADLITSYEFSDSASVMYVGQTWYTQTVQIKKDLLAKVALLKEKIVGYRHFEARDALSNEKVGEVTAFSGSLEVYK